MDTSEPYHYAKAKHKLPNFLSFACKKSDLDSLLVSSTLNAPFKTLYFSKHGGLKKNKVDEKVLVALAHLEPDGPTLKIYSVPRGLAGIIRSLMKEALLVCWIVPKSRGTALTTILRAAVFPTFFGMRL